MQGVRVEPTLPEGNFLVDVVCDCGWNGLAESVTGESCFKHPIGYSETMVLVCGQCQSEYSVFVQDRHVHVTNKSLPPGSRVLFYGGSQYFLSNFSSFKVGWRNVDWDTAEHAYQAYKFFGNEKIFELIRGARSAHEAKKIAQAHEGEVVANWPEVKLSVMEEILRAKLSQHPYIQRKLLETGDREIVENSPSDSFWGRGSDWKGQNWLGKLWMKLRAELKDGTEDLAAKLERG